MKNIIKKLLRESFKYEFTDDIEFLRNSIKNPTNNIKSKIKPEIKPKPEYITTDELIMHEKEVALDGFGTEAGRSYSDVVWLDPKVIIVRKELHGNDFNKNYFNLSLSLIRHGEELPPILVDYDYTILEGYNRYKAAKLIGVKKIPAIVWLKNT
jgi:hypothetical protein